MTSISKSLSNYYISELNSKINNQNEVNENFTQIKEILSSRSLDNDDNSNKDHVCKIGKDVRYFSTIIKNNHNKLNYANSVNANSSLEHNAVINIKLSNLNHLTVEDCIIVKQFPDNTLERKNIDNNQFQYSKNYNENLFINNLSLLQEITPDSDINILKIKKKLQEFQKVKKSNKVKPVNKSSII
ncbi:MAG: hypothetical protein EKK61_05110 [Rickettsiales bacterium]|nr:MAG: hypothetical protein EKK61_05110 [Rickettsiales bacterium]